jgi:hypothetical protein
MVKEDDFKTMPPNDEEFQEVDNQSFFSGKNDNISFKDIILRAIEKVRIEASKEMVKGGERLIFSKDLNDYIPITLPDQRKLYEQSIILLHDLLLWYFDENAIKTFKEIENNIENAYKKHFDEYLLKEYWIPYKQTAEQSGLIQTGQYSNVGAYFVQKYEDYVFNQYRKMFQELILLYKRKNDLSNKKVLDYYST